MYEVQDKAHKKFLDEVLSLLVKPVREGIFKLLDLLPVGQAPENESPRDHLVDDAAQSPEVRAISH